MQYPKVKSALAIDDHTLLIELDNDKKRKYDVTPPLKKDMFSPLRNPAFLRRCR